MAQAPIGPNLDKPSDIALNLAAKVTFDLIIAVQDLTQTTDLRLAQIFYSLSRIDARLLAKLNDVVLADAVNERERILRRLIPRNIDTCDTCHRFVVGCRLLVVEIETQKSKIKNRAHPCRCLCFGFWQITRT